MTTKVRAYPLKNGDIFTVKDSLTIEFQDGLLHEVTFDGYDEYMQSIYTKTGKMFTFEEFNEHCK